MAHAGSIARTRAAAESMDGWVYRLIDPDRNCARMFVPPCPSREQHVGLPSGSRNVGRDTTRDPCLQRVRIMKSPLAQSLTGTTTDAIES